jgi:predicted DNA binding protein
VLPKDLPTAITYLEDEEFDRLFRVTVDEARRRGRLPNSVEARLETTSAISEEARKRPSREAVAVPLTRGQVNAVRAAFKAGITPSRIARQFGLSQSDVRKALASPELKR